MSIALERSNGIEGTGFGPRISDIPIYESPEIGGVRSGERRLPAAGWKVRTRPVAVEAPAERVEESTSCSSSIGRNSDCSTGSDGEDLGETEVQSKYKGPLDTMDALEEALPNNKRGISKFYCGKSKSFTSLADVSPSSVKDLAKPENSHTRKRKNLLASTCNWDGGHHHHHHPSSSSSSTGGGSTSKRPANSSRSTLLLPTIAAAAAATSGSDSNSNSIEGEHDPSRLLPPLHPNGKFSSPPPNPPPCGSTPPLLKCSFSTRSFSLTDLQAATTSTGSSIRSRGKHERFY